MKRLICAMLLLASIGVLSGQVRAQDSSFIKIASVTTLTYTDTAVVSGQYNLYSVTAVVGTVESGPSNIMTALTPNNANAHSNMLTWTPVPLAKSYNVYKKLNPLILGAVSN